MNRSSRTLLLSAITATGLVAAYVWSPQHTAAPPLQPVSTLPPTKPGATAARADAATKPRDTSADAASRIAEILAQLAGSKDAAANRAALSALRGFLNSLPPAVASRAVQTFLAGNQDASTQLDLTVQPGGVLGDASSLRVFLMDYLGRIDRSAAGAMAAQTLSRYTTPDEWAVSLRNYAWANPGPGGEAYLQAKTRELLHNPAWLKEPSAGFLEAFDTIVQARGTALAPDLAALVRDKDNNATAHAAYLTLDRLTINEPMAMFKQFIEHPELMTSREQTRANYLARADVRVPEQRAMLEEYLLDPARSPQELATFAGVYPNANYMISNNLLTSSVTPSRDDLIKHDVAALSVIDEWLADAKFSPLKPHLETMRMRLETFVRQAAENK